MNIERLSKILDETTVQLRKGEEVETRSAKGLEVTEVYAMPHESEVPNTIVKVDCHFITVGVDKEKAESLKDEVAQLLNEWLLEASGSSIPKLEEGPSYIHVGGVLGDQGLAFQLFALGEVLGLWKVITPQTLGITGDQATELAGRGMIMIDGYKAA